MSPESRDHEYHYQQINLSLNLQFLGEKKTQLVLQFIVGCVTAAVWLFQYSIKKNNVYEFNVKSSTGKILYADILLRNMGKMKIY